MRRSRQTKSILEEMHGRGQRHGGHSAFKTPWHLHLTLFGQLKRLVREWLSFPWRPKSYYLDFSTFFPSPASQKLQVEDAEGIGYLLGRLKTLSLLRSSRSSRSQRLPMSMLVDGLGVIRKELWPKQRDRLQDSMVLLSPVPPLCLLSTLPTLWASGGFLELDPVLMWSQGRG